MGHANLVKHAAGWMEGGLTASFEKVVLDAELLQMMAAFMTPIEVNEDTLDLDATREVGPGGHFFGAAHTLARYETAFYAPILSDWRNFEAWTLPARRMPPSAPAGSTRLTWPNTSRCRSTRRSPRSSRPSSPGARRKAASWPRDTDHKRKKGSWNLFLAWFARAQAGAS